VAARLGGRAYLAGERFGAADLTFAALAAPVLLPAGHPALAGDAAALPEPMRATVARLRATAAGAWALGLYARHRRESGVAAAA
jgi:glutathione S-transferase